MTDALITLTTDFGTRSPFVAAMKGVIVSLAPQTRILDLSHEIPPYDLRHIAFFLAESLPLFPPGTIHVVVVDPEVGSSRDALYVEVAGQRLLLPDNGCWTRLGEPTVVRRLSERRYWRDTLSSTFHGRDVFAPVAAHLSRGVDPAELGPQVTTWRKLDWPEPKGDLGEIVFVDHFGNLISNLRGDRVSSGWRLARLGDTLAPRVRTYSDAAPGQLVALVSSSGFVEVAEVQGNAAARLQLGVGAALRVE